MRKKKNWPEVTIIILNFNGLEDTRRCLASLKKTQYSNFKTVVVDNGSKQNEAEILKKEFTDPWFFFIRYRKNFGFAGGNNRALKKVKSKYVALLNNDTVVTPFWLSKLIKIAESDPTIAICQPKIRSLYKKEYFEYAGAAGGFLDQLGYPYAQGRILFHLEKDIGQYDKTIDLFWASGVAMLIRRSIIAKTGMLDEDFFAYQEEIDFCWRVLREGFRIVLVPKSIVFHKGTGTSESHLGQKTYLVHRNNLMLMLQNFSLKRLAWVLPIRLFLDLASMAFYLFVRRFDFIIAVPKAYASLVVKLPLIVKKRTKARMENLEQVEKRLTPKSIIWEYFIQGKRRFSEIRRESKKRVMAPTIYYEDLFPLKSVSAKRQKIKSFLRAILPFSFLVVLTLLIRLPSLDLPFDRDEGTYAYIGWTMLKKGVVPYRDIFDHKTPLTYLVYGVISSLFGYSFFPVRVFSLIYFLASLFVLFRLSERYFGKKTAFITGLLFSFYGNSFLLKSQGMNTEHLLTLPLLVSFWLFLEALRKNDPRRALFLSGLLAGIAILFKQVVLTTIGAFLVIILFMANKKYSRKTIFNRLALFLLGVILPTIPFVIYFGLHSALSDALFSTIIFNLRYVWEGFKAQSIGVKTKTPGFLGYFKWLFLFPKTLPLFVLIGLISLKKLFVAKRTLFIPVFLFVASVWLGVKLGGSREAPHYYVPLISALAFASAYIFSDWIAQGKNVLVAITVFLLIGIVVWSNFRLWSGGSYKIQFAQFGTQADWFHDAPKVASYLRENTAQEEEIYVWANEPEIYFYAQRKSASPFLYLYGFSHILDGEKRWFSELLVKQPGVIVTYTSKGEPMHSTFARFREKAQYEERAIIGSYRVFFHSEK